MLRFSRIFEGPWGDFILAGALALLCLAGTGVLFAQTPVPPPESAPPVDDAATGEPARPTDRPAASRQLVGKIRGTIQAPGKTPVPGLLVQLASSDEQGTLRITGTDEKGQYLFRDLPPGVYEIQVTPNGYARETKGEIVVRPPFQNIVDFQLEMKVAAPETEAPETAPSAPSRPRFDAPPVPVTGTFLDQENRPVAEVSVTLFSHDGGGVYQDVSGLDGRFMIPEVIPGLYRALITSPGHVTLDLKSVQVPGASGLNLSLSLVDFPLNVEGRENDLLPHEEPRLLPESRDLKPDEPDSAS